jgi:tRNA1(Val) A37 N6-methylase TrmN6
MALMFARLARNFVKNGYFPTDEATLSRVQNFLRPPRSKPGRMLDPCCGEGSALADLRQGMKDDQQAGELEALGVEFDKERAWHAKSLLDRVIHADLHDVVIKPRSIGLLFLNPPYGFGVTDSESRRGAEIDQEKAERLERTFLRKTAPLLALGGVMVFIIPFYALDEEIRVYLARNFTRLRFFMAPEKQFKQCVIFGIKTKPAHPAKDVLQMLARAQAGELNEQELPEVWDEEPYTMAPVGDSSEFNFHAVRMDAEQLQDELNRYRHSLLWHGFETFFNQVKTTHKRPLRDMTQWHLALALAAGQVTGKITSKSGRTFLIKGNTFKRKDRSVETVVDGDGDISETIVMLDKFVPVINAIEFTPGDRLGQVVKIS